MKFLFTIQPGIGHLRPIIPIARALEQAGHTVAFACAKSFRPSVEAAGFKALAAGLDWLESEPEHAFPEMVDMSIAERDEALTDIFVDISAHYMSHDLLEICREWQPDALVRDYSEYGACIVSELLSIPQAVIGLALYIPDYITKLVMEKPLVYLRTVYDLPPYPALEMLNKYLYLSLLPPTYQFPEYRLPPTAHTIQPASLEKMGDEALPEWVPHLADQPTLFVSMGTVFNRVPEIYKTILEGLRDQPVNLILAIGYNQDPAQFGPLPDNVYIEHFIPQISLMPYCDLVISHGGINTILTSLSFGVPLVTIPLVAHQLQNVVRCKALGVGIPLWPREQGIDFDPQQDTPLDAPQTAAIGLFSESTATLTTETIKEAVFMVLKETGYRKEAQKMQTEMLTLPDVGHGVYLLEKLARERKPILAFP